MRVCELDSPALGGGPVAGSCNTVMNNRIVCKVEISLNGDYILHHTTAAKDTRLRYVRKVYKSLRAFAETVEAYLRYYPSNLPEEAQQTHQILGSKLH